MCEKELNKNYIKGKLQGICQDCVYLDKITPVIEKMMSERYIDGLQQGKFDTTMDLIRYLESLLTGKDTIDEFIVTSVTDLLERVKSGKYE